MNKDIYTYADSKIIRKAIRIKLKELNLKYNLISVKHSTGTAYDWITVTHNKNLDPVLFNKIESVYVFFGLYYNQFNDGHYNLKEAISPKEREYYIKEKFIPYLEYKGIDYLN